MSMTDTVDNVLSDLFETLGVERIVSPPRAVRFAEFAAVGASGAAINTAVFLLAVQHIHYILAGTAAFTVAVTWNFAFNWLVTFNKPTGSLRRQYLQFVAVSLGGFVIHLLTLVAVIDGAGGSPLAANLAGIVTSGVWNFFGADEFAFDDTASLGEKAAVSLNRAVHLLYRGRVKELVRGTWLYHLAFGAYCRVFNAIAGNTITIHVGPGATFVTETGAEAVSIHHTVTKERPVLDAFTDDIRPGDVVWDVGANLGVFACLAARAGGDVLAVEPFEPTADRIHDNAQQSGVDDRVRVAPVALGDTSGSLALGMERTDIGTQTPTLGGGDMRSTRSVPVYVGDEVAGSRWPRPDVVKVDVEGAEVSVLGGLAGTLDGVRVAYVEAHSGRELSTLTQRLDAHGFQVEQIHEYDRERYLRAVRR